MSSRLGQGPASLPDVPEGLISPAPSDRRGKTTTVAILTGIAVGVILIAAYGYDRTTASHYYPGTRIGDVAVGSRSLDEASELLHERFVTPLREPITLTAPQYKKRVTPWKMGLRVDVSDAARDALSSQRNESAFVRMWHRIVGDDRNLSLRPEVNDKIFDRFLEKVFKKVKQDPKDAWLDVSKDELVVVPHQLGRKVKGSAEKSIRNDLVGHDEKIKIPVKIIEPVLTTEDFKRVILVSTGSNRLTLYKNGEVSKKYGVATGTGGYPTPHGQFYITLKRMNPSWVNPYADWSLDMPPVIPPGPNNPLGTRALNLSASGIRIHGTPDSGSIGTNASHGCIRMLMSDAEDLFERVDVGTPVLIVG